MKCLSRIVRVSVCGDSPHAISLEDLVGLDFLEARLDFTVHRPALRVQQL